jgi:hypothetical protein
LTRKALTDNLQLGELRELLGMQQVIINYGVCKHKSFFAAADQVIDRRVAAINGPIQFGN